jgi:hypothetical protein
MCVLYDAPRETVIVFELKVQANIHCDYCIAVIIVIKILERYGHLNCNAV